MAKKHPQITIQEISGDQFPDLETAQRAALDPIAAHLVNTIQELILAGRLVNINGKIIPNPKR